MLASKQHSQSGYLKNTGARVYTDFDQENALKKHMFIERQNN